MGVPFFFFTRPRAKRIPGLALFIIGLLFLLAAVSAACEQPSRANDSLTPGETVTVPAGWFWMGENDGRPSNEPRHQVYLNAYIIHRTEVTRGEFAAFISETGYAAEGWPVGRPTPQSEDRDYPATGVEWQDADAYCRWVGMRLPTEAEWEKAARGEDGRIYPWGNDWDATKANTAEAGHGETRLVGSFREGASPYGALDMTGNAAEWVNDYFDFRYYHNAPDHNPAGPTTVLDHGLRGGWYNAPRQFCTTYFRDSSHSGRPNPRVGFRCASGE